MPVPATIEVTPELVTVWLGNVPETEIPVPATVAAVVEPVPPLATGRIPVTPVVRLN
jgi:hypothetical protein